MLTVIEDTHPILFEYYKTFYDRNRQVFESDDFDYIITFLNNSQPTTEIIHYLQKNELAIRMVRSGNTINIAFPHKPKEYRRAKKQTQGQGQGQGQANGNKSLLDRLKRGFGLG